MKIHFKSTHGPQDNPNVIEFYSDLEIGTYKDLDVLDFQEKRTIETNGKIEQKIIATKIEYNDHQVAIYSGPSTLEMEKDQVVRNSYLNGAIDSIYVLLKEVIKKSQGVIFRYLIATNEQMEDANHFELDLSFINDEATNA